MMRTLQAVCMKCDQMFTIHEETGRNAHLLHCVRCGREKRIRVADIKESCNRSLTPFPVPTIPGKKNMTGSARPVFSDREIDCRKYTYMVEHIAGSCICGAVFRFSGKPRCPICRSAVIRTQHTGKSFIVPAAQAVHA